MHSTLIRHVADLRFQHPCSLLISGTTGSGKTHFTKNLVEYKGIAGPITRIFLFLPRIEPVEIAAPTGQELFLMEGLPTQNWVDITFKSGPGNALIIIDDQWSRCIDSKVIEFLLTFGRRHLGLSLIFITQNFYEKSKISITLR